jgi:hypothetical protein
MTTKDFFHILLTPNLTEIELIKNEFGGMAFRFSVFAREGSGRTYKVGRNTKPPSFSVFGN